MPVMQTIVSTQYANMFLSLCAYIYIKLRAHIDFAFCLLLIRVRFSFFHLKAWQCRIGRTIDRDERSNVVLLSKSLRMIVTSKWWRSSILKLSLFYLFFLFYKKTQTQNVGEGERDWITELNGFWSLFLTKHVRDVVGFSQSSPVMLGQSRSCCMSIWICEWENGQKFLSPELSFGDVMMLLGISFLSCELIETLKTLKNLSSSIIVDYSPKNNNNKRLIATRKVREVQEDFEHCGLGQIMLM